jgi:hypothetical protein
VSRHVYETRADWLAGRRDGYGIGASDTPKIVGVSSYGGPWTIYRAHHDPTVTDDASPAEHLALGSDLEPVTLRAYGRQQRIEIEHLDLCTYHHPRIDWLRMSPDGITGDIDEPDHHYEAKAVMNASVAGLLPPAGELPLEAFAVPHWTYQAIHQLAAVPSLEAVTVVALLPWFEVRGYTLDRRAVEHKIGPIMQRVRDWRQTHLVEGHPPDIDDTDDCARGLDWMCPAPDDWPDRVRDRPRRDATTEEITAAHSYAMAKDTEAGARVMRKHARNVLVSSMGDAYQVDLPDGGHVRISAGAQRRVTVRL